MSIKLTYFDFNGGRGEECRLALHVAQVPFDDQRIGFADWASLKPQTPWKNLPVLELDGQAIGQTNAILTWIGRGHDLHPTDPWEAARHEAVLSAAEDLRHAVGPTLRMSDPTEKQAAREALAKGYIPQWGADVEAQIGEGPFLAGDRIHIADLKLFVVVNWFAIGAVDHIPGEVFSDCPKLNALHQAVAQHPAVQSWYAAH